MSKRIIVAVTGASGAVYAQGLLERLADAAIDTHLIVSPHGRELIADELGIVQTTPESLVGRERAGMITHHDYADVGALPASGSFLTDGMIICPCSSNTLAQVAAGIASNLITRAAAVHLKEGRRLVLLTREMPVSQIELTNMLRVSQAGGIICPASPGYYLQPKTIQDLVDFIVGKLCDLVQVDHSLRTRWDPAMRQSRNPPRP
jgi:flavin prenyltransferase